MNDSTPLPLESELASFMEMARNRINNNELLSLPLTIGQYRLERLVGQGGMGDVYEAQNTVLNRTEAIKFIRSKLILNPSAIERFEKEIEATAKLLHPNIVTVFNAGQYNGRQFMTMEFLEGMTVHQYVRQRMELNLPLTIKEAVDIIIQAAKGLQFAHDKGFIHRDVKPGNLWIMPDGTVKVLDLGLVLPMAHGESDVQIVGTPDFMAPEQVSCELRVASCEKKSEKREARSESILSNNWTSNTHCEISQLATCNSQLKQSLTPNADIYSLGCTFFYLLTGHVPFEGKEYSTSVQKMEAQRTQALPQLSQFRKDVPSQIQTIINRMTAKAPADRYESMNEVIEALKKKSVFKPILLAVAGVFLFGTVLWWGLDKMIQKSVEKVVQNSEISQNSDSQQADLQQEPVLEPQNLDVIEPFPVGQEAGEKLVRVVDGVEYVFRWCPPGTFMMGNPGVYISKEMSLEQMLEIVKSNNLLDEKLLSRHETALQDILKEEQRKGNSKWTDRKRLEECLFLYLELTRLPDVNTEAPSRQITLTQGFWMLDCEVTCQMWFSVMKDSPANAEIQNLAGDNLNTPVRKVTWNDAMDFCKAMSEKLNADVQLPTEAQWEYACRAGTEETPELRHSQAIYYRDKMGGHPAIVRSKSPNAWGLYDMPGNVEEWCSDWFEPITDSQPLTDPIGPDHSTPYQTTPRENAKVLRGGHYLTNGVFASRSYENVETSRVTAGFRVCVGQK